MSHRPDPVTAKETAVQFTPHPADLYPMVCVDCIDLGERVKSFKGETPYLAHCVTLVFQSGEKNAEGRLHEVSREFTVSMGKKASLRAFLESWRSKGYTEEEARAGVELHKLVGANALIAVEHVTSAATGRTYANIRSISKLPKGMSAPMLPPYERPAFFTEKAAKYAEEVRVYRDAATPLPTSARVAGPTTLTPHDGYDEPPVGLAPSEDDQDDTLPW